MLQSFGEPDRVSYYRACLHALAFVESRHPTGRRFGPDADARWSSFQGDLGPSDRINLLIRDADAQWPGAFGARAAFGLRAVAEDEPFGAEWPALDDVPAEELWRSVTRSTTVTDLRGAVNACAAAWDVKLQWPSPPDVAPADRIVIAGPSLVAALQLAFSGRADLDWAEQVTVVASPPSHRQIAGLASAFLNLGKSTKVVASDAAVSVSPAHRLFISADASDSDRQALQALGPNRLTIVGAA